MDTLKAQLLVQLLDHKYLPPIGIQPHSTIRSNCFRLFRFQTQPNERHYSNHYSLSCSTCECRMSNQLNHSVLLSMSMKIHHHCCPKHSSSSACDFPPVRHAHASLLQSNELSMASLSANTHHSTSCHRMQLYKQILCNSHRCRWARMSDKMCWGPDRKQDKLETMHTQKYCLLIPHMCQHRSKMKKM